MSKDKVVELAKERALLVVQYDAIKGQLDKINAELFAVINGTTAPEVVVERKPLKKPAKTKKTKTEEIHKQPSMKEVVQEIISRNSEGLELKNIVAEVTQMIKDGKYTTKAKNYTPLVSQALHQLKTDGLIQPKQTETKRHLYVTQVTEKVETEAVAV